MAEAIVALNRAGVTAYEARHVRPRWEVEALLLSAIAEAEARRRAMSDRQEPVVIPNPEGEPAPAWVMDLPVT